MIFNDFFKKVFINMFFVNLKKKKDYLNNIKINKIWLLSVFDTSLKPSKSTQSNV